VARKGATLGSWEVLTHALRSVEEPAASQKPVDHSAFWWAGFSIDRGLMPHIFAGYEQGLLRSRHASTGCMHPVLNSTDPQVRSWLRPEGATSTTADSAWIERFLGQGQWDREALLDCVDGVTSAHRQWAAQHGALVVAGQQPAIGGGPLYTLAKTAQAVATARQLDCAERPVLPAFWCASDDHDLGEADHADLITRDGRIARFRHELGPQRGALRHHRASTGWTDLIAFVRTSLGPGVGEQFLADHAPRGEEDVGAWQCRLLRALFPGLLTFEAWRLRPRWRQHLDQVVTQWPSEALADLRSTILAAGFSDAFGPLTTPPLFHDQLQQRLPLTGTALRAVLAANPDTLSPGAALRPVLQQAAMPAAVVVLGPGEMAYHSFLGPVYASLGLPRPLIAPRRSVMLEPGWFQRGCQAWNITSEDLHPDRPIPPVSLGESPLKALDQALADLAHADLPDPQRQSGLARLQRERDRLARSLERAQRQRAQRPAFGALRSWAYPRNAPQDRCMSLIQAIWQCGPGLGETMVQALGNTAVNPLPIPC
jgi:hypothetical protein